MHLSRRHFLAGGISVAGAVALGACGDDDAASDAAVVPGTDDPGAEPQLDLPTNDEESLKAIFDPLFKPLQQHVTRIGLFDLEAGFVSDDQATHLAIYVEPIDPDAEGWDDVRYIETVAPGLAVCTPFLFEQWSDLQSMDLCQEPPQAQNADEEPPIETQVFLGRADSAQIDWETVDLVALVEASIVRPDTVRIGARPGIEQNELWTAAQTEAAARIDTN